MKSHRGLTLTEVALSLLTFIALFLARGHLRRLLPWPAHPAHLSQPCGQNVMYFSGGRIILAEGIPYASDDPRDNIYFPTFVPSYDWGEDTDAYLWEVPKARTGQ